MTNKELTNEEITRDITAFLKLENHFCYASAFSAIKEALDAKDSKIEHLEAEIQRQKERVEKLTEALRFQMNYRMRDGSLCCCSLGVDEDEPHGKIRPMLKPHSTACTTAREALQKDSQ